jgi:serine/threonine-protein kinase
MVFVPWPGAPSTGGGGQPAVRSVAGFFIDRTEVTTAAYRRCVLAGRCVPAKRVVLTPGAIKMLAAASADTDEHASPEQLAAAWKSRCNEVRDARDHPANCVNFASARDYCRFAGSRLPTASEWIRAARLGDDRRFAWGDEQPNCDFACFGRNGSCLSAQRTLTSCAVGRHPRDRAASGLLDMSGNVAEWVSDPSGKAQDPQTPAPRLIMGGSFADGVAHVSLATRRALPPVSAHVTIGMRCARNLDNPAPAATSP